MNEQEKKGMSKGLLIGLGCGCALLAVPMLGIIAAIAIPNFVSMQYKAKRSEIPMYMKQIKYAEEAYEANFDIFVAAAQYPEEPLPKLQPWFKSSSGGFATLGWSPDGLNSLTTSKRSLTRRPRVLHKFDRPLRAIGQVGSLS